MAEGTSFDGSIFTFGSWGEYHPIAAKDKSRTHQFGYKTLKVIFLVCVLQAGRQACLSEDSLLADGRDFQELEAAEVFVKRCESQEVFLSMA